VLLKRHTVSTFPEEIKVIFHGASSPRELVYCFSLASRETVLPGLPAHISVQGNRSTSYSIRIPVQGNCSMKHFIIAGFYAVYNYSSILQTTQSDYNVSSPHIETVCLLTHNG
jgi:hypothetical protein